MASTTYVDLQGPLIAAAWLNDINSVAYTILGNGTVVPTTKAIARTNLGVVASTGTAALESGTYVTGDILYASATNTLSKLAVGATGAVLTIAGGVPTWSMASSITSSTWSTKPGSPTVGQIVRMTDVGGGQAGTAGGTHWFYTGARWKAVNNSCQLDTIDTPNAGSANTTEQNLNPNYANIPAGVIQATDRFEIVLGMSKSGTSDSSQLRVRLGPNATTADPIIAQITGLSGSNVSAGYRLMFKRTSATTVRRQGSGDVNNSFGGAATSAYPSDVTVANLDSSIMRLTIWQLMTTGSEFLTVQDYVLNLYSTDS